MSKIASKITDLIAGTPFCDTSERAQTLYFNWLVNQMYMDSWYGRSYYVLAKILHNIEFYWTIDLDENRAKDGIRLRHVWFDAINNEADALGISRPLFPLDSLSGSCSILEMLVALANRIECDIMQDDNIGNRAPVWFWRILANIGIAEYDDTKLGLAQSNVVSHEVMNMMDRKYDEKGRGGSLFPLTECYGRDMRETDIWWQAQLWLSENYPNEKIGLDEKLIGGDN